MIDVDRANAALAACAVGHTLIHRKRVDSTMTPAREPNLPSGAVVVAEEQSAGRGRLGRVWDAPAGLGLLCTVRLSGPQLPTSPGVGPMLAAVAIMDALTATAPALQGPLALKWPNDVLVRNGPGAGKIAGVLAESILQGGEQSVLLLGMGINVNQRRDQLPPTASASMEPTSVLCATGEILDRTALLIQLCQALERRLAGEQEETQVLYHAWRNSLQTLGQSVTVSQPGTGVIAAGRAVDVHADGSLVIEQADGSCVAIASGDVTLRSPQQTMSQNGNPGLA